MTDLPVHNKASLTMAQSPRSKRGMMLYLALFLGLSWTAYTLFTRTRTGESAIATHEDGSAVANDDGTQQYGLNAQPDLTGIIKLADLPPDLLPQTGKHRHTGRLVIVGDVHGMKDALVDLLDKINFNIRHDHLILAGDMISKGPDSPGVVDLAMKLGATGVRGNHEDRILLAHADMEAKHLSMDAPGPSENKEKGRDGLEEESFNHGDYKDRKLAKELGEHRIKWLKKCPVILRVGKLGSLGEVVVVHAGLAPGVKLEKQDPVMVMTMRTMKDGVPSNEREGHPWQKAWNKHQKSLPKKERASVIYGHDSKRGLAIEDYSMGIDTGCLKGGRLTAVVIEGGHSDHTHKVVHVNCKDGRA